MSDCSEQNYNSWCGVLGANNTQKLLCVWHLDCAWRKALYEHVSSQQHRIEIYHQLRVLLQQRDEIAFLVSLQQTMPYLHENYEEFYKYFNTHYVPHIKHWATCYIVGTIVNTNMFAKAFHCALKVINFNNKENRRIDLLIYMFLCISKKLI